MRILNKAEELHILNCQLPFEECERCQNIEMRDESDFDQTVEKLPNARIRGIKYDNFE